jgi:hypothetical protein
MLAFPKEVRFRAPPAWVRRWRPSMKFINQGSARIIDLNEIINGADFVSEF